MLPRCRPRAVVLHAGRLVETDGQLRDLATGLPAHLSARLLPAADAATWRTTSAPVPARPRHDGVAIVDEWLGVDSLNRWVVRRIAVQVPHPSTGFHLAAGERWLSTAARARADGELPVHVCALAYLDGIDPRCLPPLLVGAPTSARMVGPPPVLLAWIAEGARCVAVADAPSWPEAAPGDEQQERGRGARHWHPHSTEHLRDVRRLWRRHAPRHTSSRVTTGKREMTMTHLELLDVATQIEEVRQDLDALVKACRLARQHTHAAHVAVVVRHGRTAIVAASDGDASDSSSVWPHLCVAEGPASLVSAAGWHAAARQGAESGDVWVGARWPSSAAGEGHVALLAVFARVVASRVVPTATTAASAPGPAEALAESLVGESLVMRDVRAQIALAARAPFPVLIRGESGCGKELAARAIHAIGVRRHRRCAAINCAALPDELIESELFGHVRGAFTGAATDRAGLFDDADGGTLFLDEVGELGGKAQAKLLRVLQDGEVRRVGENHARRVDVRVIAATNVSLDEAVRRGVFRADLFYRLDVVRVRMPSLRERREDVPILARHFWRECTARVGSHARLDGRVLDVLAQYDWPGNVRQLQNTLAALAVRVPARGRVQLDDLPPELRSGGSSTNGAPGGLDAARREFEAHYVRDALTRAGGRPTRAARDLGVTRQGLTKLVRRLGLDTSGGMPRLP
ncbi:MAG TPA: sigma-54 dependent transcriptional regulator [Luteitalea sp.]|nr:sigma-54 dependent transcriptional regulator [Luteitalea sp.]